MAHLFRSAGYNFLEAYQHEFTAEQKDEMFATFDNLITVSELLDDTTDWKKIYVLSLTFSKMLFEPSFMEGLTAGGFILNRIYKYGNNQFITGFIRKEALDQIIFDLPENLYMVLNRRFVVANNEIKRYNDAGVNFGDIIEIEDDPDEEFIDSVCCDMMKYNKYMKEKLMNSYYAVKFAIISEQNLSDIVRELCQTIAILPLNPEEVVADDIYDHISIVFNARKNIHTAAINNLPEDELAQIIMFHHTFHFNDETRQLVEVNTNELEEFLESTGLPITVVE